MPLENDIQQLIEAVNRLTEAFHSYGASAAQAASTLAPAQPSGAPPAPAAEGPPPPSPTVLAFAKESGVDLSLVTGTGKEGRVTKKDVQGYIDANTPPVTGSSVTPLLLTAGQQAPQVPPALAPVASVPDPFAAPQPPAPQPPAPQAPAPQAPPIPTPVPAPDPQAPFITLENLQSRIAEIYAAVSSEPDLEVAMKQIIFKHGVRSLNEMSVDKYPVVLEEAEAILTTFHGRRSG